MKKRLKKSKIFNSINIILVALVFVELIFMVNWMVTGNPVRTASLDETSQQVNIQSSLGQLVTKEGKVELIIQDNFEKPELSKELYYLNENGNRYLLSTDSALPVSAKIKVTGYLKDDVLSFSDSQTKSASLQGTSYVVTSTTVGPWPKTLGNQKYIIVFLSYPNESNENDPQNFTKEIISLANGFMYNNSYGLVNITGDYFGERVIPTNITWNFEGSAFNILYNEGINLSRYDGIIVYHPNTDNTPYSGMATVGKHTYYTLNETHFNLSMIGINKLYKFNYPLDDYGTVVHEMGHNFGLMHASLLKCGEYPNKKTIDGICAYYPQFEYGDYYDVMGFSSRKEDFGLRNKIFTLGWLNETNIVNAFEGTFFVYPISDSLSISKLKGIMIPLSWDLNNRVIIEYPNEYQAPIQESEGVTDYFIEYRNHFEPYYFGEQYDNETFYSLNLSAINKGVTIKLGRNSMNNFQSTGYFSSKTFLLSMHPNSRICFDNGKCYTDYPPGVFAFLLENETYLDSFNKMSIKVLDMNDSGALVKISSCSDSDSGKNYYLKGTLDDGSTDTCLSSSTLIEKYCTIEYESASESYSCPSGQACTNGACVCVPSCVGKVCGDNGCGGSCGTCAGALACNNGICSASCTDTDGGNVPTIKGTATVTNASGTYTFNDYCQSAIMLKEYYCNNNQAVLTTYSCGDNGCVSGACRQSSTKCYYDKFLQRKVCNKGGPIEA